MRKHVLSDCRYPGIESMKDPVAILPIGATEAHGQHLPYGTDTLETVAIGEEACRLAAEEGAEILLLPAIPFGNQSTHAGVPLDVGLTNRTLHGVILDVALGLLSGGHRKLVILNGHGGNDLKGIVRDVYLELRDVLICITNWYDVIPGLRDICPGPGDHAHDMETSFMLHLHPDLVAPKDEWGDGASRKFGVEGLNDGTAWAPRRWLLHHPDLGSGDPSAATAEKGRRMFEAVTQRIARFLADMAASPVEGILPSGPA